MDLNQYLENLTSLTQNKHLQTDIPQKTTGLTHSDNICPLCNGNLFTLYEDEKGYTVSRPCACREKRIAENRLKFASIPIAYKGMLLKNFNWQIYLKSDSRQLIGLAIEILKKYLSNMDTNKLEGIGLYIYSNAKGSGKTRLAASMANEIMEKHSTQVKFAVSTKILSEIKKTYESRNEEYTESRLMSDLFLAQVLVIDDFGTEKISDWVNEKFFDIINERYLNKKITIFTSNLAIEELPHDARIRSRIKERAILIKFPEEDIRERISQKLNSDYLEGGA